MNNSNIGVLQLQQAYRDLSRKAQEQEAQLDLLQKILICIMHRDLKQDSVFASEEDFRNAFISPEGKKHDLSLAVSIGDDDILKVVIDRVEPEQKKEATVLTATGSTTVEVVK